MRPDMDIALIAIFAIVSLFSALFMVRRYQAATRAQRMQMVWAAGGAAAVAAGALVLFFLS